MTRGIRRLTLYVLVGMSVAGLAFAQTPGGQQVREAEEALEETLEESEEALMALASPRTGYFSVYRDPTIWGHYCFSMWDYIAMSYYDAQGYLNNGATLRIAMWGDDGGLTGNDDLLIGPLVLGQNGNGSPYYVGFYAQSGLYEGIHISWSGCVPGRVLNEDAGGDELYVASTVIDGDGGILRRLQTPRVYGNY